MIVVDTNVIAYLFITGDHTELVQRVLAKDADWLVPPLWQSEFRNVLVQYLRHQIITLEDARIIYKEAAAFLDGQAFSVYTDQVLHLAATSNCSAYDCEFVALARDFGVPLLTTDKRILRDFPETAVLPANFVNDVG